MRFLRVLRVVAKRGLIQNLVNDWAALYSMALYTRHCSTKFDALSQHLWIAPSPRMGPFKIQCSILLIAYPVFSVNDYHFGEFGQYSLNLTNDKCNIDVIEEPVNSNLRKSLLGHFWSGEKIVKIVYFSRTIEART